MKTSRNSRFIAAGLAIAAGALAAPASALADVPGYYAGVHLGANDLDDWSHRANFGAGVGADGTLTLDNKVHWGIAGGMQTASARFELELAGGRFAVEGTTLGGVMAPADARGRYVAVFANAYRVFQVNARTNLYVGAGVGAAHTSLPALPPILGCGCYGGASDTGIALQVRAGAEQNFGDGHRLFLQYSILRLPGADSGGAASVSYGNKTLGAVTAGYRRTF